MNNPTDDVANATFAAAAECSISSTLVGKGRSDDSRWKSPNGRIGRDGSLNGTSSLACFPRLFDEPESEKDTGGSTPRVFTEVSTFNELVIGGSTNARDMEEVDDELTVDFFVVGFLPRFPVRAEGAETGNIEDCVFKLAKSNALRGSYVIELVDKGAASIEDAFLGLPLDLKEISTPGSARREACELDREEEKFAPDAAPSP